MLSAHLGRPLTLIAESDMNDPTLITSREAHGYGLDAQWSDDYHHALHVALTGETTGYYADFEGLSVLARALTHGFVHDGTLVELPRAAPRPADRPADHAHEPARHVRAGPRPDRQPRRRRPAVADPLPRRGSRSAPC